MDGGGALSAVVAAAVVMLFIWLFVSMGERYEGDVEPGWKTGPYIPRGGEGPGVYR